MNCPTTHHLNGTRSHASRQRWSAAGLWKLLVVGFIAAAVGCLSRVERPIRGAPPPREQWREIGSEDFTVRACPKYAPMWLRNDCELAYTNEGLLEIMPTSFFGYRRMHNRMYSVALRPKAGEELFIDGGYWTIQSFTDEEISIQGEPPDEKTGGRFRTMHSRWIVPSQARAIAHGWQVFVESVPDTDDGELVAKILLGPCDSSSVLHIPLEPMRPEKPHVSRGDYLRFGQFSYQVQEIVADGSTRSQRGWIDLNPICRHVEVGGATFTRGARLDLLDVKLVDGVARAHVVMTDLRRHAQDDGANLLDDEAGIDIINVATLKRCQEIGGCDVVFQDWAIAGKTLTVGDYSLVIKDIEFRENQKSSITVEHDPEYPH